MNCRTGEISMDPEVIEQWRELGIPVLSLPEIKPIEPLPSQVEAAREVFGLRPGELLAAIGAEVGLPESVFGQCSTEREHERRTADFLRKIHRGT